MPPPAACILQRLALCHGTPSAHSWRPFATEAGFVQTHLAFIVLAGERSLPGCLLPSGDGRRRSLGVPQHYRSLGSPSTSTVDSGAIEKPHGQAGKDFRWSLGICSGPAGDAASQGRASSSSDIERHWLGITTVVELAAVSTIGTAGPRKSSSSASELPHQH